jgi:hypothetical protein
MRWHLGSACAALIRRSVADLATSRRALNPALFALMVAALFPLALNRNPTS